MAKIKVIYAIGNPIFLYREANKIGYSSDEVLDKTLNGNKYYYEMDLLLDYLRNTSKTDILFAFEYLFLKLVDDEFFARHELDSNIIQGYRIDNLDDTLSPNPPKPTYISEYINIIGQLFLAGYIDFLCEWDNSDKIDYPTNLSYYKEDKYQAWIYFRDNFFYVNKFNRDLDDDIIINGYSTMYSPTSWDTPQYWSEYNILVAQTPKGTKYFNEILAPRFYNKYKDLSVEIDEKGNIVRWIGKINR